MKKQLLSLRILRWAVLLLVLVLSLASFSSLTYDDDLVSIILPEKTPYRQSQARFEPLFDTEEMTMFYLSPLEEGQELFSTGTFESLAIVVEAIEASGLFSQVTSITNLQLLDAGQGELRTLPLVPSLQSQSDILSARAVIESSESLEQTLLTPLGNGFVVYALPDPKGTPQFAEGIENLLSIAENEGLDAVPIGQSYTRDLSQEMVLHELFRITPLSLFVLLLVFLLLTGKPRSSGLLLSFSLIPAIIVFGLFSLLGFPLNTISVLLPVIVFSLTTAYSIHLYRSACRHPESMKLAVREVFLTISIAAATTALGYTNLLFLHSVAYRQLGIGLLVGVGCGYLVSILYAPDLLGLSDLSQGTSKRWETKLIEGLRTHELQIRLLLGSILLLSVAGSIWYFGSEERVYPTLKEFREGTPIAELGKRVDSYAPDALYVDLYLESSEEYGWVSTGLFFMAEDLTALLKEDPAVLSVLSYTDAVNLGNGLLYGIRGDVGCENESEIGETLELLYSEKAGIPIDYLITPDYSVIRLQVCLGGPDVQKGFYRIESMIDSYLESVKGLSSYHLSADPAAERQIVALLGKTLKRSQLLFSAIILLAGLVLLRSVRQALLLLLPSISGLLLYLSLLQLTGRPLDANVLFSIYTLIGVSVDDTAYLLISWRQLCREHVTNASILEAVWARTGLGILETTFVVCLGLLPVLTVGFLPLAFAVGLTLVSYLFASGITLFLLPRLLLWERRDYEGERP